MWALGLALWMFDRDRRPLIDALQTKFGAKGDKLVEANIAALNAGHAYGETAEIGRPLKQIPGPARGNAARPVPHGDRGRDDRARLGGREPTRRPADVLGLLSDHAGEPDPAPFGEAERIRRHNFQAEDEIAAVCSAIGASYAGHLGVTSSSGPGIALKERGARPRDHVRTAAGRRQLQRGGPSTGLPTKTEQSDLFQAVYGRNGDAPLAVLAARSPSDCFEVAIEAVRLAVQFMTPVILLTDGYIANAAEPWRVPDMAAYQSFPAEFFSEVPVEGRINPYQRDPQTLKRVWIKPGTPGLTHRIGGIEKGFTTGEISYEPANHQKMTDTRKAKIDGIAQVHSASRRCRWVIPTASLPWSDGARPTGRSSRPCGGRGRAAPTSAISILRYLWPLPRNLGRIATQLRAHSRSGDEYRPTEDRSPRPVSRRRQAAQQGLGPTVHDCRDRSGDRTGAWPEELIP